MFHHLRERGERGKKGGERKGGRERREEGREGGREREERRLTISCNLHAFCTCSQLKGPAELIILEFWPLHHALRFLLPASCTNKSLLR